MTKKLYFFILFICFKTLAMEEPEFPSLKQLIKNKLDMGKIDPSKLPIDLKEELITAQGSSKQIMNYLETPDLNTITNIKLFAQLSKALFHDFCNNKIDLKEFLTWADQFINKQNQPDYYKSSIISSLEHLSYPALSVRVKQGIDSGMPGYFPSRSEYKAPLALETYIELIKNSYNDSDSPRKQFSHLLALSFLNKIENQLLNAVIKAPAFIQTTKAHNYTLDPMAPQWDITFNNSSPLNIDESGMAHLSSCITHLISFMNDQKITSRQISDQLYGLGRMIQFLQDKEDDTVQIYVTKEK